MHLEIPILGSFLEFVSDNAEQLCVWLVSLWVINHSLRSTRSQSEPSKAEIANRLIWVIGFLSCLWFLHLYLMPEYLNRRYGWLPIGIGHMSFHAPFLSLFAITTYSDTRSRRLFAYPFMIVAAGSMLMLAFFDLIFGGFLSMLACHVIEFVGSPTRFFGQVWTCDPNNLPSDFARLALKICIAGITCSLLAAVTLLTSKSRKADMVCLPCIAITVGLVMWAYQVLNQVSASLITAFAVQDSFVWLLRMSLAIPFAVFLSTAGAAKSCDPATPFEKPAMHSTSWFSLLAAAVVTLILVLELHYECFGGAIISTENLRLQRIPLEWLFLQLVAIMACMKAICLYSPLSVHANIQQAQEVEMPVLQRCLRSGLWLITILCFAHLLMTSMVLMYVYEQWIF